MHFLDQAMKKRIGKTQPTACGTFRTMQTLWPCCRGWTCPKTRAHTSAQQTTLISSKQLSMDINYQGICTSTTVPSATVSAYCRGFSIVEMEGRAGTRGRTMFSITLAHICAHKRVVSSTSFSILQLCLHLCSRISETHGFRSCCFWNITFATL